MKKIFTLFTAFLFLISFATAQYGYVPEKLSGNLNYTDLSNPANPTLIGVGPTQLGASDFDLAGNYFGIGEADNTLYQIDITNASSTVIATVTPPGGEFWTGMACDPTDGTMYICSTDGNGSSFYTLDVSTGATTLVGTNSVESGVVGIAFTDDGQMYAIYLVRKFYEIDKSDATPTLVGSMNTACTALTHHGLDFDPATQTMYMVSYNAFSFDNELWTIDVNTGANTLVGSVGIWTGTIAVEASFSAGFTSDITSVCEGGTVNFTDLSAGGPTSWTWTFEGGTPASSSAQNPSVVYNTAGTYDVTLEVSNGSANSTLMMPDYITVDAVPVQATMPSGPDETCQGQEYDYTVTAVANASSYDWQVDPANAGTIIGASTIGTFTAAANWSGAYTVKVRAVNDCGNGAWSPALSATLYEAPNPYFLTGGGSYCEGEPGMELILDGSETGFDYELYYDDVATGNILAGTGSALNFGYHTDEGLYTVKGFSVNCIVNMFGQAFISIMPVPGTPGAPVGSTITCNNETDEYTTNGSADADTLYWEIDPVDAAVLTPGLSMVEVNWNEDFSGQATLSVYGSNDCGDSDPASLSISVNVAPTPDVSGLALVCEDDYADYSTENNTGSTYEWEVVGGTISSGAGTHMITVHWGDPGVGSVSVTEDNGNCVETSSILEITIDECIGLDENILAQAMVYPNPAKDVLYISVPGLQKVSLSVVNLVGQQMINLEDLQLESSGTSLNIQGLEKGVYFLHISDTRGNYFTSRFIKTK